MSDASDKSQPKDFQYLKDIEKILDRSKDVFRDGLTKLRDGLSKETDETKEMLEIYYRWTNGKASDEELAKANEQFADVVKAMGLGVFLLLPAAPITIPFFVKLGKIVGIDVLPSAFRESEQSSEDEKK